jgi:hypothetical protein
MNWLPGSTATTTACSKSRRPAIGPTCSAAATTSYTTRSCGIATTVAYGRCWNFKSDSRKRPAWLRRAQTVRSKILASFWPSTKPRDPNARLSFADQQFAVGDASYLLAEITPFAFNWRCDVLGNIQAFIGNVLDVDRARTAFRFMWGVGVNEPLPVANLYPPCKPAIPTGAPTTR